MKKISIIVPCYNEEETINIYFNAMTKMKNEANKDAEKFSLEMPLPFYQYPLQVQKLETEIPCEARTAGLIIYYPLSMLLAYGV